MKIYSYLFVFLFVASNALGQEFDKYVVEAKSAYSGNNLEDTRFALQQALTELDIALGKEILALLPGEMLQMSADESSDDVTGNAMGFTGLYVNRSYLGENQSASVQLITDSPLLTSINAILALPGIVTAGNENQKRIKIDGYKALMERNEGDSGDVSYSIQVPLNQSLLTFECDGIDDENQVVNLVNSIPVGKIVQLIQ